MLEGVEPDGEARGARTTMEADRKDRMRHSERSARSRFPTGRREREIRDEIWHGNHSLKHVIQGSLSNGKI